MSKRSGVFLLLGPEAGEKEEFINSIRSGIEKKNGERPEETKFYAFDTAIDAVLAHLRNGSLFSAHKLVIFDGAEQLKKKDEVTALSAYCEAPAQDATLVLVSEDTQVDKRLKSAVGQEATKIFWEMFDNQKIGWVTSYFRKHGNAITPDAAELLLELVENNTLELKKECDRLSLFFGRDHRIETDDIDTYIYHSKEENAFTLFEEIAACNLESSLEILQKIMLGADGNPIQILAGLMWQFRKLLALHLLLEERHAMHEAFAKLSIRSKKTQRNFEAAARNFPKDALERIVVSGGRLDARLRQLGNALHPLLMQMFVYAVVVRKGRDVEPDHFEKGEYEL